VYTAHIALIEVKCKDFIVNVNLKRLWSGTVCVAMILDEDNMVNICKVKVNICRFPSLDTHLKSSSAPSPDSFRQSNPTLEDWCMAPPSWAYLQALFLTPNEV
jgi:hypothetical protein